MIGNLVLHDPSAYPSIDISDADVVLFGVPRSATALTFQLLQSLFPFGGTIYTHSFIYPRPSVWCIGTYRDFRACTVSYWRYTTQPANHSKMSESQVRRFAGRILEFISALTYYKNRCNPTWIPYESHMGNPGLILDMISSEYTRRTGQLIRPSFRRRAEAYLSKASQQGLFSSNQLPLFRPNHIMDGSTDGWKHWLSPSMLQLLTDILAEPLTEWGYSL